MKKVLSLIKSSLHDYRCCDEMVTIPVNGVVLLWRALQSSLTCVLDGNNKNTGFVHVVTLEQYDAAIGTPNGVTKVNNPGDANYIPDYLDNATCPYRTLIPVQHNFTLSNVAPNIAGNLIVVNGVTVPYDVDFYQSMDSLGDGLITFTVQSRSFNDPNAPLPVVVDVDGTLHDSQGDITLSVNSPIYSIVIRPSGYVAS